MRQQVPPPPSPYLHEFNMCSNVCRGASSGGPADLVNFLAALDDPWAIMLNEICSPEYIKIRDALASRADMLRSVSSRNTRKEHAFSTAMPCSIGAFRLARCGNSP